MRACVIFLLISCLALGCAKVPNSSTSSTEVKPPKYQLLFLTLDMKKAEGGILFTVANQKVVDGKLKKPLPSELNLAEYLRLSFQTSDKQEVTQIAVENPLDKWVEAPNGDGSFSRVKLNLDSAKISVRLQYDSSISELVISDNSGVMLSKLSLNQ